MPMHVRNWWLKAFVDGRESSLEGGPRSKDGGFRMHLYQRDKGEITEAVSMVGWVSGDKLILDVSLNGESHRIETRRTGK